MTSHRMSGSPEYLIWANMIYRCGNSNASAYRHYGGRGIKVCERWMSFAAFFADMGARPTAKHQIDRRDNEAGYSPENCRWATRKEQANNRRTSRMITFRGATRTLEQWAERLKISVQSLSFRLDKWTKTRALTSARTDANRPQNR